MNVTTFTYVIPDLHGRSDLLCDGMAKIAKHGFERPGTIVLLGDYVDKGPGSKAVIDRLRAYPSSGRKLIALKGNHDAMMVEGLRDRSKLNRWLERGGDEAIKSYGGEPSDVPEADIEWLNQLSLMHIDTHRLYVHAGVDSGIPLRDQSQRTLLWKRYPKGFKGGYNGLHVVHGHDSFERGPLLYPGRTNLDTRAWRTGRLVIGVFDDDKPGGPIDFIVVTRPANSWYRRIFFELKRFIGSKTQRA